MLVQVIKHFSARPGRQLLGRFLLHLLIIVAVLCQPPDSLAKSNKVKAGQFQFAIILDKQIYKSSDPISMDLTIKNSGKQPVWVNTRFYLSSPEVSADDRDVWLSVTSPSGERLPCTYAYPTGFPKSDYFALVQPGEEVKSEHQKNLKAYFEIKELGTYKVVATYHNIYGKEIGLDAFQGPISSEPVTFTIE